MKQNQEVKEVQQGEGWKISLAICFEIFMIIVGILVGCTILVSGSLGDDYGSLFAFGIFGVNVFLFLSYVCDK